MKTNLVGAIALLAVVSFCQRPKLQYKISAQEVDGLITEFTEQRIKYHLGYGPEGATPTNKKILTDIAKAKGFDENAFLSALKNHKPNLHAKLLGRGK